MSDTTARQNELLDQLACGDAQAAQAFAARIHGLAELSDLADAEEAVSGFEQFPAMEMAGTRRLSRAAADNEIVDALRYREALPLTLQLLGSGELFVHQARTMLTTTINCQAEIARKAEADVLGNGGCGLCPPDLRRRLKKALLQAESDVDSEACMQRLLKARAGRRTWIQPEPDGMAKICALVPAEASAQWAKDMERLVLQEKAHDRELGVWRSADQIRADLLTALPGWLLAARAQDGGPRLAPLKDTLVNLLVPAATALELGNEPGELERYGPISAEHVRLLLPDARLRRAFVDATAGEPLSVDDEVQPTSGDVEVARGRIVAMLRPTVVTHTAEPQHDPSAALRRFVQLRSPRCDGVGCSVPASQCHLDHRIAYPAGPTAEWNLDPRSAGCHKAKHSGWQVTIEQDGSTTWTSPLGRVYRRPPPYDPPLLPPDGIRLRPPRKLPAEPAPEPGSDELMLAQPGPVFEVDLRGWHRRPGWDDAIAF